MLRGQAVNHQNTRPFQVDWSTGVSGNTKNGDMSQASITSSVTNLAGLRNVSYQLKWTGGTGTISIQVSNNYDPHLATGDWEPLDSSSFSPALSQPAGSAGSQFIEIPDIDAEWIRVKYTRTGGSGTLTGWVKAKGG